MSLPVVGSKVIYHGQPFVLHKIHPLFCELVFDGSQSCLLVFAEDYPDILDDSDQLSLFYPLAFPPP